MGIIENLEKRVNDVQYGQVTIGACCPLCGESTHDITGLYMNWIETGKLTMYFDCPNCHQTVWIFAEGIPQEYKNKKRVEAHP